MLEKIITNSIILLGGGKEQFKMSHPNFTYVNERLDEKKDTMARYVVTGKNWRKCAEELESRGLIFWTDIFPDWAEKLIIEGEYFVFEDVKKYCENDIERMEDVFEYISKYKKIAAVYGNCQSYYLSMLLQKSTQIAEHYVMCRFPWIQNIVDEKKTGFSEKYMSKIDLFIYQNAGRDNVFGEKLSTDVILPLLKKEAVKVSIPFVYFNGYFPQYIKNVRNDDTRRGEGHVPYGDCKIQEFLEAGYTVKETINKLKSPNLFSEKEVWENISETLRELKKREEKCDIKISDFIEKHYKSEYLFYSPSHPTNFCLQELVKRILHYAGFKSEEIDYTSVSENDRYEMYVYPSVRNILGLTFSRGKFCLYRNDKSDEGYGIEEYVAEYAKYCFPEINESFKRNMRALDVSHMLHLNEKIVKERRQSVLRLSGRNMHMSLYVTAECDSPTGTLFHIKEQYAPGYSYVTVAMTAVSGAAFPCVVYPNGDGHIILKNVKKGTVIILDTTWIIK